MGSRALVQFVDSDNEFSPVCYLHWDGGRVREFIEECSVLMESRGEDVFYAFARFVGICHTHIEGNMSLGVDNIDHVLTVEDSYGDHGCFVVHCGTWEIKQFG